MHLSVTPIPPLTLSRPAYLSLSHLSLSLFLCHPDAEGSPFKGTPFDPSAINFSGGGLPAGITLPP